MHELSITEAIIAICLKNCAGRKVQSVTIEIGTLSGFMPEAIEFCFTACSKETPLDGARLLIEQVPGRGLCNECNNYSEILNIFDPCPQCGSQTLTLMSGNELRVKELEVVD